MPGVFRLDQLLLDSAGLSSLTIASSGGSSLQLTGSGPAFLRREYLHAGAIDRSGMEDAKKRVDEWIDAGRDGGGNHDD